MTPGSPATHALLPSSFSRSRLSARQWLAATGGLGCASWSLAGMYPQFDGGSLRVVLALSSLVFGGLVSLWANKAQTRTHAFWRAVGFAAALGFASTIVPLGIICASEPGSVGVGIFFGAMFGIPTGLFYGIPLGILAAATHRAVRAGSHDGTDRAARAGGFWLGAMAVLATTFSLTTDWLRHESPETYMAIPAMLTSLLFVASSALVVRAFTRLAARRTFVARITAGEEPMFRIRPASDRDLPPFTDAPRISGDDRVVEWFPDGATPSAYRAMAQGVPVAMIGN